MKILSKFSNFKEKKKKKKSSLMTNTNTNDILGQLYVF